jgi:hypothetical protein
LRQPARKIGDTVRSAKGSHGVEVHQGHAQQADSTIAQEAATTASGKFDVRIAASRG